jgi:hypothetical protein
MASQVEPRSVFVSNLTPEQKRLWDRWNEAHTMTQRIKHGFLLRFDNPERGRFIQELELSVEAYRQKWISALDQLRCETSDRYSHHAHTWNGYAVYWCDGRTNDEPIQNS